MAIDVYLQIDGIMGESTDDTHKDRIECLSVDWSLRQPRSATASTAGGHTAERVELSDISFHKMRADGDGARIKYYEIELENVLISYLAPSVVPGSTMSEAVSLKFSQVKWRYTRQRVSGGASGNTAGGWNLSTNRMA